MALHPRWATGIAHATNFALATMVCVALYWLVLDRALPITIESYSLAQSQVRPGDAIELTVNLTRHRSCPARITRYLRDSRDITFAIPPAARQVTMNGHDQIVIRVPAPAEAAAGPAAFWSEAEYRCNPLQALWPIVVRSPEVSLLIVAKESP